MDPKRAVVILAYGFEETEAVSTIDVLRRAGVDVTVAGLAEDTSTVAGAHGIVLAVDTTLNRCVADRVDLVALPGGMPGARNLADSPGVRAFVATVYRNGGVVGAICAAPVALQAAGILEGRTVTSYPAFRDKLTGVTYREDRVVCDGTLVTSRGPATAIEFGLALVKTLGAEDKADELARAMLVTHP